MLRVVVEMLPRSEWQTKTTALVKTEEEKEEGKTEAPEREWKKDTDTVMPTGMMTMLLYGFESRL